MAREDEAPLTMDGHSAEHLAELEALENDAIEPGGPDDRRFQSPDFPGEEIVDDIEGKDEGQDVKDRTSAQWQQLLDDKEKQTEGLKTDLYRQRERARISESERDQVIQNQPRPVKEVTLAEGVAEIADDGTIKVNSDKLEEAMHNAGVRAQAAAQAQQVQPAANYDTIKHTFLSRLEGDERKKGDAAVNDLETAYAFIDRELGAELQAQGRRPDSIRTTGELVTLFDQSGISARYEKEFGDMRVPIESILMGASNPELFETVVTRYMRDGGKKSGPLEGETIVDRHSTLRDRPRSMAQRGAGGAATARATIQSVSSMTPTETFQATRDDLAEMEELAKVLKE